MSKQGDGYNPLLDQNFFVPILSLFIKLILIPFLLAVFLSRNVYGVIARRFPNLSKIQRLLFQTGISCAITAVFLIPLFIFTVPPGQNDFKTIVAVILLAGVFLTVKASSGSGLTKNNVFGKQRWANIQDLQGAGLISSAPGLILGKNQKNLIGPTTTTDWHAFMVGGQGTGKTSNGIIPTLLSFEGSAVVLDIKGDIYDATAGYRSQLGPVYRINPCDINTWVYDPVALCDDTPQGIIECAEIGRQLIPDPPGGAGQNQWVIDGARGLISALAYITAIEEGSLHDLALLLTTHSADELGDIIEATGDHVPFVYGQSYLVSDQKIRGYYISSASDYMRNFALDHELIRATTPIVGRNFTFNMLEQPSTVYLQIPEHKLRQSADLWRLVFMQLLRRLQMRGERPKNHILVCLDEFPQLGKMDQLPEMFATLRSRNVHVVIAGQSVADIDAKYQPVTRRRIIDSCNYVCIYGVTDPEGQKYFSDMIGQQTVVARSGGTSDSDSKTQFGGSKGKNQGWQETGKPLVRPEDLRNLGGELIVVARQTWPLKLQKAFYKSVPVLANRSQISI